MPRTLIKNGQVVTSEAVRTLDVALEDGHIIDVKAAIPAEMDDRIIDASGLLILPGIVDAHTHIKLDTGLFKTADNWLIGSRSGAAGGVTTVIDFATQYPGQGFREAVEDRLVEAQDSIIDYAFHCMVTQLPVGAEDELRTLIEMGIPSFKVYTTYRPNYYMDDATLFRLMKKAGEIGGLVIVHAENDAIVSEATQHLVNSGWTQWRYHAQGRPAVAEQEAVHRVLFLAGQAKSPIYVVHCSTSHSVELVQQTRTMGTNAWCETCPQYLLLDERVYEGDHPEHYILQPPLRAEEEPSKLWNLVQAGAVSVISTDTCDYTLVQKREFQEFTRTPGGLPGIETLLPLIYTYGVETGRLQLTDVARLLCENPARLFGIDHRKGFIRPGADADIVLYDPEPETALKQESTHYLAGYSPYEGMRIRGEVQLTISRGDIIYERGKLTDVVGRGEFVPGKPFSIDITDL